MASSATSSAARTVNPSGTAVGVAVEEDGGGEVLAAVEQLLGGVERA